MFVFSYNSSEVGTTRLGSLCCGESESTRKARCVLFLVVIWDGRVKVENR